MLWSLEHVFPKYLVSGMELRLSSANGISFPEQIWTSLLPLFSPIPKRSKAISRKQKQSCSESPGACTPSTLLGAPAGKRASRDSHQGFSTCCRKCVNIYIVYTIYIVFIFIYIYVSYIYCMCMHIRQQPV